MRSQGQTRPDGTSDALDLGAEILDRGQTAELGGTLAGARRSVYDRGGFLVSYEALAHPVQVLIRLDLDALRSMATRAARSKTGRCKSGPVTLRLTSRPKWEGLK